MGPTNIFSNTIFIQAVFIKNTIFPNGGNYIYIYVIFKYEIHPQYLETWWLKSQILVCNRIRVSESELHTPTQFFGSTSWGGFAESGLPPKSKGNRILTGLINIQF